MTDCAELNGDCANIADEANYNSMLNSKPLPGLPTGATCGWRTASGVTPRFSAPEWMVFWYQRMMGLCHGNVTTSQSILCTESI
jgi:hypothetical protein